MSELLNNIKRLTLSLLSTTPKLTVFQYQAVCVGLYVYEPHYGSQERRGAEEPEKDWYRWGALFEKSTSIKIDETYAFTVTEPVSLVRDSM